MRKKDDELHPILENAEIKNIELSQPVVIKQLKIMINHYAALSL